MIPCIIGLISCIAWIYILIDSFKHGCLWPIFVFLLPPIGVLVYVLTTYEGSKAKVLLAFYLPQALAFIGWLLHL